MSTSSINSPQPPPNTLHRIPKRRAGTPECLSTTALVSRNGDTEEAAFWSRYEEREEGRFAQEADYLFDTSSMWAA